MSRDSSSSPSYSFFFRRSAFSFSSFSKSANVLMLAIVASTKFWPLFEQKLVPPCHSSA